MGNKDEITLEDSTEESIDLDTDPATQLDEAMREALEAIEGGPHSAGKREAEAAGEPSEAPDEASDLAAQLAEQRERALRALADLENFRKRTQREREEERRFRAFEPMREFLSVVDNLERALKSEGSMADLKEGVGMILRQMDNLMRDHGVEPVEAVGRPFDPSVHEAVSREESTAVRVPTVSEELQSGYTMHGRLLRPSVVKVSMPAGPGGGNKEGAE